MKLTSCKEACQFKTFSNQCAYSVQHLHVAGTLGIQKRKTRAKLWLVLSGNLQICYWPRLWRRTWRCDPKQTRDEQKCCMHETFDGCILAIRTSKKYDLKYPLTLRPETHLLTVLSQLLFFVWMCYPLISKLQGDSVNLLTRHVSYISTYSYYVAIQSNSCYRN